MPTFLAFFLHLMIILKLEHIFNSILQSLLDQVNILIKMKVGDPYRLQHIKLMLKQKRSVYGSDRAYLDHLIHDYIEEVKTQKKLSKIRGENPFEENSETITSDEDVEDDDDDLVVLENIYCWKCGKSIPVNSKFCLSCGCDVKNPEVKEEDAEELTKKLPEELTKKLSNDSIENNSSNGNKKNLFIIIGVLAILVVIGGAVVMGGGFDKYDSLGDDGSLPTLKEVTSETKISDSTSKCGAGTVFDDATNTCLLEGTQTTSKCGAGTVFDDATNTCLLE
mgnify:FL=1